MKTDITIVLDRSGSMKDVKDDTIGGFNTFLDGLSDEDVTVSLVQFDDQYDVLYENRPIKDAPRLDHHSFVPRGMTALLDATGKTINRTGKRLSELSEKPDKVIFVVSTDGFENHSQEYTRDKIFEMITHQREKYGWEFVFLGAKQDAIQEGGGMGYQAQQSMSGGVTGQSVRQMYNSLGRTVSKVASGQSLHVSFTEEDRELQYKEGAVKPGEEPKKKA